MLCVSCDEVECLTRQHLRFLGGLWEFFAVGSGLFKIFIFHSETRCEQAMNFLLCLSSAAAAATSTRQGFGTQRRGRAELLPFEAGGKPT